MALQRRRWRRHCDQAARAHGSGPRRCADTARPATDPASGRAGSMKKERERERERERAATQQGMTLIECMIALTLGMLVILAATALLLSAQKTYLAIDDSARIGDTGAFAMDALAAAIRQATYADYSGAVTPPKPPGNTLFGLDDAALKGRSQYPTRTRGINGSDALFTRFMATDAAGA